MSALLSGTLVKVKRWSPAMSGESVKAAKSGNMTQRRIGEQTPALQKRLIPLAFPFRASAASCKSPGSSLHPRQSQATLPMTNVIDQSAAQYVTKHCNGLPTSGREEKARSCTSAKEIQRSYHFQPRFQFGPHCRNSVDHESRSRWIVEQEDASSVETD